MATRTIVECDHKGCPARFEGDTSHPPGWFIVSCQRFYEMDDHGKVIREYCIDGNFCPDHALVIVDRLGAIVPITIRKHGDGR